MFEMIKKFKNIFLSINLFSQKEIKSFAHAHDFFSYDDLWNDDI